MQVLQTASLVTCSMQASIAPSNGARARCTRRPQAFRPFIATVHSTTSGRRRSLITRAAAEAQVDTKEHLQLATARLPRGLNVLGFTDSLYQWAATLTSSGRNMPFALPIRADKLKNGFQVK